MVLGLSRRLKGETAWFFLFQHFFCFPLDNPLVTLFFAVFRADVPQSAPTGDMRLPRRFAPRNDSVLSIPSAITGLDERQGW